MAKYKTVLIIAPHADDEVLGCGGALQYYRAQGHRVVVNIVSSRVITPEETAAYTKETKSIVSSVARLLDINDVFYCNLPDEKLDNKLIDVIVPIENLLGKREEGFKIALNILNIGRIKLGAGVLGGCRGIISSVIQYSTERIQFGVPINTFGAIKNKIAQMIVKTFACEAISYRSGQEIENKVVEFEKDGFQLFVGARNFFLREIETFFSQKCSTPNFVKP